MKTSFTKIDILCYEVYHNSKVDYFTVIPEQHGVSIQLIKDDLSIAEVFSESIVDCINNALSMLRRIDEG